MEMKNKIFGNGMILRKINETDALRVISIANDLDVSRYITIPYPYKLESALEFIKKTHDDARLNKDYTWAITLNDTLIGISSLKNIDFNLKSAEIGYWLGKDYWNKGRMSKVLDLIIEYAKNDLNLDNLYAKVFSGNTSSLRLLEKKGFKLIYSVKKEWKNEGILDEYFLLRGLK